ncbi:MAG TPA: hypothetical protein DEF88_04240 [Porphyromonadaceae bacterium]|jgi:hypothetical protein|nr:hypothetical protein [Porphyromonadaceae bacterium]HCM20941.1 hypothetical protein [Porphyromonadaceae bacterium]
MKDLISHIEFLLHTYDCVVVPGFGGFVVNAVPVQKDGIAAFRAPAYELVFNRNLSYNDGLLAESYRRIKGVSFEKATRMIEEDVQRLKQEIRQYKRLKMAALGEFVLNEEGRLLYLAPPFVRPDIFGLTDVALKPVIQMKPVSASIQSVKKPVMRNIGMGAAAAAVVALLLTILPAGDTSTIHQNAQLFNESGLFQRYEPSKGISNTAPVADIFTGTKNRTVSTAPSEALPHSETVNPSSAVNSTVGNESQIADAKRYYIVTGVYKMPDVAQKAIQTLKTKGFRDVSQLKRSGRTDVYIASFPDKADAEVYLRQVHAQHPSLHDAWILHY